MRFAASPNTCCWLRGSGNVIRDVERQLCPVACLSTFIGATGLTINSISKEKGVGGPAACEEVAAKRERDSAKHKSQRRTDRTRTVGPTLKKGGVSMTTTVSDKVKKIKAVLGFGGVSDTDLLKRLDAIRDGMTGNAAFPSPPVDMATFKTAIDLFNTLVTDALDGGKKTISAKRKQREVVIKMATQLGHYVEGAS